MSDYTGIAKRLSERYGVTAVNDQQRDDLASFVICGTEEQIEAFAKRLYRVAKVTYMVSNWEVSDMLMLTVWLSNADCDALLSEEAS